MPLNSRARSAFILSILLTSAVGAAPRELPRSIGSPLEKRLGSAYPTQGAGTFLTSGETVTFRLPQGPALFTGGFRVEAPPGPRSIRIDIDSQSPGADLDLFVRFGQDVGLNFGEESDYQAATPGSPTESIVIDAT